jgi:hypothetical protein
MINPNLLNYSFVFSEVLSDLKFSFGIKPTLIEKVHLKNIVLESIERAKQHLTRYDEFNPISDSKVLFMLELYDHDIRGREAQFFWLRRNSIQRLGFDGVHEYFRRRQEEMHII